MSYPSDFVPRECRCIITTDANGVVIADRTPIVYDLANSDISEKDLDRKGFVYLGIGEFYSSKNLTTGYESKLSGKGHFWKRKK